MNMGSDFVITSKFHQLKYLIADALTVLIIENCIARRHFKVKNIHFIFLNYILLTSKS